MSQSFYGSGFKKSLPPVDDEDGPNDVALSDCANPILECGQDIVSRRTMEENSLGQSSSSQDAWSAFFLHSRDRAGIPLAPPAKTKPPQDPKVPMLNTGHIPVLRNETVDSLLAPGLEGVYVDGTFGRGGHSMEILRRLPANSRLIAFDVDPSAIKVGQELEKQDERFTIMHRPFGDIGSALAGLSLAGVMIDIGFSSPQVDEQHRGFSVVDDGPFDLRMNPKHGIPASEWLQTVTVAELAWVIHEYGEDDDPIMSQRIAEAVLERQRRIGPYTSTLQIAEVIRKVKLGLDDRGQHPAKLTFQAIRVFLNQEMQQLDAFMENAMPLLQPGARMVVITFKKPEASAVKRFTRMHEKSHPQIEKIVNISRLAELYPLLTTTKPFAVRQVCDPKGPTQLEIQQNKRARSSMVHALEKLSWDPRSSPCLGMLHKDPKLQLREPCPVPFGSGGQQ